MIVLAKKEEIPVILSITRACAQKMIANNIFQWNEVYPSEEAFTQDIERQELYILKKEETVIGTIVISTLMDEEYIPVQWLTSNENNIYIHRLSIHPDFQGKGYAQRLMDFGETFAKTHHFQSVRLDTFSQNPRNQKFYEQRGYKRLGSIYFPKQSKHPFYCYELLL